MWRDIGVSNMRWIVVVASLSTLLWLAYQGYEDPRFQDLIHPRSVLIPPSRQAAPLEPARTRWPARPDSRPAGEDNEPDRGVGSGELGQPAATAGGDLPNSAAGRELVRALLGILAARKLASGISLSVDEEKLSVYGEVADIEKKRQIVEILHGARGNRELDVSGLLVRPSC